jgi:Short C-terminal domain
MIGRRGRPGLVGMAARTAVVAGTATAVSGAVSRNQQQHAAAAESQAAEQANDAAAQQALAAQQAQQAAAATVAGTAAAAPAGGDAVAQIQQLAALRDQGILTEEEFAAKKAQLLGI